MIYLVFCAGVLLGVFLGILVVGLCRMASERNRASFANPYFAAELSPPLNAMERNLDEVFQ